MREASSGSLKVSVEHAGAVSMVRVEGEIDLDNADQLATALRSADAEDRPWVVLDLLGVPFMDSSGLKALLVASAELGDRLSLVLSPGAPVARLLEIAEVRDRFAIHDDPEEALRHAQGGGS
jgi:stage II sporulation protein AA (anti-sigma F factor antagonist)